MNSILKILIAAACVCVIAVSGHYGWSTYRDNQAVAQRAKIARDAAIAEYNERLKQSADAAERRNDEARTALLAECDRRVPSQSTDNLKALYQRCLANNAMIYGVSSP